MTGNNVCCVLYSFFDKKDKEPLSTINIKRRQKSASFGFVSSFFIHFHEFHMQFPITYIYVNLFFDFSPEYTMYNLFYFLKTCRIFTFQPSIFDDSKVNTFFSFFPQKMRFRSCYQNVRLFLTM